MKDFKQTNVGYYHPEQCNLDDFKNVIGKKLSADSVPNSSAIEKNIPIYDNGTLRDIFQNEENQTNEENHTLEPIDR